MLFRSSELKFSEQAHEAKTIACACQLAGASKVTAEYLQIGLVLKLELVKLEQAEAEAEACLELGIAWMQQGKSPLRRFSDIVLACSYLCNFLLFGALVLAVCPPLPEAAKS